MIDRTFRAGEKFRPIHTEARKMQFLYADGTDAHFMDEESYEQIALPETSVDEPLKWVKPNESVDMLYIDGEPADIQLGASVELEVTHTEPGVRGDTASRRRQQARDARDRRDRERPAVREHRRPDQGRHALGLVHVARLSARDGAADTDPVRIRLLLALACAAVLLALGSRDVFWADYFVEAWPALLPACASTASTTFLRLMPAYSGFVTLIGAPTRAARRRAWTGRSA